MALLSKPQLEQLRQALGAPQLVFTQEQEERMLPCVRASYFKKDEVNLLIETTDADYIQVQLVLGTQGHVSMVMNGAATDAASSGPGNLVFITLADEGGELGLLSDIDCPPRCEDDDDNDPG